MSAPLPTEITPMVRFDYTLGELGKMLCIQHGLHEGRFQVGVNIRVGIGAIQGPPGTTIVPGATVGFEGVSFAQVDAGLEGPDIVDAAAVNPRTP